MLSSTKKISGFLILRIPFEYSSKTVRGGFEFALLPQHVSNIKMIRWIARVSFTAVLSPPAASLTRYFETVLRPLLEVGPAGQSG